MDSVGRVYGHNTRGPGFTNDVLFRVSSDGTTEVLHTFASAEELGEPSGPLYIDENDNVYGVFMGVNPSNTGAAFKWEPNGKITVLKTPASGAVCSDFPGSGPGLIRIPDGRFFGATAIGGTFQRGSIFSIDAAFTKVTEIFSFKSYRKQGYCVTGPLLWNNGRLNGVTRYGGSLNVGAVFSVKADGSDFRSMGMVHGSYPTPGLTPDGLGYMWGGSFSRAVKPHLDSIQTMGTLFRIDSTGKAEIVHRFSREEGFNLNSRLVLGLDGKLYGTSLRTGVGAQSSCKECGSIWRIDPRTLEFEVLHAMRYLEGAGINGLVLDDKTGRFYGFASLKGPSSPLNPKYPTRANSEHFAGSLFTFLPRAK